MTTEQELHGLIGRAVVDKEFRARLAADPVVAAAEVGVALTAAEAAGLKAEDGHGVAQVLAERLPKAALPSQRPFIPVCFVADAGAG